MPPHLRRFAAALLVLAICRWVISEMPSQALSSQEESLQVSRDLQSRSKALLVAGKDAEALPLVQQLHAAFPTNQIFLAQLAELQDRLGNWQACADAWEAYLKMSPTPWEAFPSLGEAYRKMGRAKDSTDAYRRGLDLDPNNSELVFYLGRAYERESQYQKAMATYLEGLKDHPNNSDLKTGLARMTLFTGKASDAQRLAEESLKRAQTSDGYLVLGMALRSQGDLPGARRQLEAAKALSPDYIDVLLVLGGVAERQNDLEAAKGAYGHILQLDPNHAGARARMAVIQKEGRK